MNIGVTGGRRFGNIAALQKRYPLTYRNHPEWEIRQAQYDFVFRTLGLIAAEFSSHYRPNIAWVPSDLTFVFGDQTGADAAAMDWAMAMKAPFRKFDADWEKFGRPAGPIRNQQILVEGKPELLVAFPGTMGTRDMIQRAERAGIPVRRIDYNVAKNINADIGL